MLMAAAPWRNQSTALGKPPLGAKAHRGAQERPSKPGFPKPFPPILFQHPRAPQQELFWRL